MKRLLALLAAVALIAGAVFVRSRFINGSKTSDDGGGASVNGKGTSTPKGKVRVRCTTELAAVCQELESRAGVTVSTGSAATAADALIAAKPVDFDLWVTPAVWADLVGAKQPAALAEPVGLARSPLVLVGSFAPTLAALKANAVCAGTLSWPCLVELGGQDWSVVGKDLPSGKVRAVPAGRMVDGFALASLGQAAADLDALGGLASRLRDELAVLGTSEDPADALLSRRAVNVAGAVEARVRGSAGVVAEVQPAAFADVVIVGVAGRKVDTKVADMARERLVKEGWSPAAAGDPPSGLPDAKRLAEARRVWER